MSIIEVIDLVKSVNFNIEEGELVGYIGENGTGKSITIKIQQNKLKGLIK